MTHPDTDVLAEYLAGLLTGRRAATVTAHLADCARCTTAADELAAVSALLAVVPAPAMPDRVAQRLDAVLAAEVAHRNESERPRGVSPREPRARRSRRTGRGGFRWISPRVLAPAGAIVVMAAAGGYFLSSHGSSQQMSGASSAAAPSAAATSAPVYGRAAAPNASAKSVPGTGSLELPDVLPVVVSPVDFLAGSLTQQLEADLRVPPAARTTHVATPAVKACVQRVAGRAVVLRVESAHYEGQPVTVVITRASAGDEVQLAGPGCSATSSQVLATRTVPAGILGP